MQCSSYIPVYYQTRDLNASASVVSWHPFDSNKNCGEERGYDIAMPPNNMDHYFGYDKEVLKQIIQNHEATFRYQVQELHRLYRTQRELMDDMRMREIIAQHLLSQTSESIHTLSQAQPKFSPTPSYATSWLLRDHSHNIQISSHFVSESYQEGATVQPDSFIKKHSCHDVKFLSSSSKGNESRILDLEIPANMYQGKQGNLSEAPNKIPLFHPASDSDMDSVKTGDSSGLHLNSRKTNFFIDLNEPVQFESSSSESPHMEIDLNSMPISCFSETEIAQEIVQSMNKESCAMKNEECVEDHPFVDNKINDKFLKNGIEIDLNTGIEGEHSPPLSSTVLEIKSEEDTELVGPLSPENEECSPPRGNSNSEVETPLLSEQGEGEPSVELDDTFAAQTLVTISSFRDHSKKSLCWFAELVSSIGDDLGNEIIKLKNDAAENGFEALRVKSEENVGKERETDNLSGKGRTRGKKQHKDFQDLQPIKGPLKRKRGRKGCAKARKYSILKQAAKQGVLQSWGEIRKRQGGRRRRATKFLVSL